MRRILKLTKGDIFEFLKTKLYSIGAAVIQLTRMACDIGDIMTSNIDKAGGV